jgi:hypothetical protein
MRSHLYRNLLQQICRSPGVIKRIVTRSRASEIIDVHTDARRTVAHQGTDIWAANVKKMRSQTPNRILAYVCNCLGYGESEQEYSD